MQIAVTHIEGYERYRLLTTVLRYRRMIAGDGVAVSRTQKDSRQRRTTALEIVRRDDLTFDLFLNGELDRSRIVEQWLPDELSVRFGFVARNETIRARSQAKG